jgi:hypothetical protein
MVVAEAEPSRIKSGRYLSTTVIVLGGWELDVALRALF